MYNKLKIASAVIVLACTGLILFNVYKKPVKQSSAESVTQQEYYILKDYCGKIAVFKGDSSTPEQIYDIFTNTLPEQDITMLTHGIEVKSENELTELINDYTS